MTSLFDQVGHLHLGSSRAIALAQGARRFANAAKAIRFAIEEVAPVSLRGASLLCGGTEFSAADMRRLYDEPGFPQPRIARSQHAA